MLDAPDVKEPESVKMPSPLTFDKMLVVNEVVCSQSTLVGVSDHEIVAGDELTSPLKCITSVSGPFVYVAAAAIGAAKMLAVFHVKVDEKVWACSQSTLVGVRFHEIVAGDELKSPLSW